MRLSEHVGFAFRGVFASKFSLLSNTVSVLIGLTFFGALVSLSVGVGEFLEKYYTRTMSLTTLLVFQNPEALEVRPFDSKYRADIKRASGAEQINYHDIDFADLAITQDRSVTVSLRSAVENDPEISRLEMVAGTNMPRLEDPSRPAVVIPLTRAHKLSNLPPKDLIGIEVSLTFARGMRAEEEDEHTSLYGTIVGIVNESPDESVYVHYGVLATMNAWCRTTVPVSAAKLPEEKRSEPSAGGGSLSSSTKTTASSERPNKDATFKTGALPSTKEGTETKSKVGPEKDIEGEQGKDKKARDVPPGTSTIEERGMLRGGAASTITLAEPKPGKAAITGSGSESAPAADGPTAPGKGGNYEAITKEDGAGPIVKPAADTAKPATIPSKPNEAKTSGTGSPAASPSERSPSNRGGETKDEAPSSGIAPTPAQPTESGHGSARGKTKYGSPTAKDGKQVAYKYKSPREAWQGVKPRLADDSIVYPNLRIHLPNVEALAKLRNYFRDKGVTTTSVLDDVAAIRDLRNYAITVGSIFGFITLIAAVCSIFNTLLASVERRTREIGILRALGASSTNVLSIFLLEGAINAIIGGLLAAAAVYFGSSLVNEWMLQRLLSNPELKRIAELKPQLFMYPLWLPWTILGVGLGTSLFAALGPAIKACWIQPTAALRSS